jgi:hypothetical protein
MFASGESGKGGGIGGPDLTTARGLIGTSPEAVGAVGSGAS